MNVEFCNLLKLFQLLKDLYKNNEIKYRILDINGKVNGSWSNWISNSTGKYLDSGFNPTLYDEIKVIQIATIENRYIGKLVANKQIDHSEEVCSIISSLNINHQIKNGIIEVY